MTSRKTSVSPTSKIVKAISFGVFWRLADSTMEIMRSRNDSPGLTVMTFGAAPMKPIGAKSRMMS